MNFFLFAVVADRLRVLPRTIVVVACFLLGAATISSSRADSRDHWPWRSASLGGGGYMQGVVFCSVPGTLHTYSDVGGVWKSTDHGVTWRIISGGLPAGDGYRNVRGLHVEAANPLRLLAAVGNPVQGYFLWSYIDNFEWEDGYDMRFGIVRCDFQSQQRTPKLSAQWYARVVAENRLV